MHHLRGITKSGWEHVEILNKPMQLQNWGGCERTVKQKEERKKKRPWETDIYSPTKAGKDISNAWQMFPPEKKDANNTYNRPKISQFNLDSRR